MSAPLGASFKATIVLFSVSMPPGPMPIPPPELIRVLHDPYRPQPRLDRDLNDGMTTVVGRLRADQALERGIKFCLLSHNTKMGAAKGAVLLAEHLVQQGLA